MSAIDRRSFVGLAGAGIAAAHLAGCDNGAAIERAIDAWGDADWSEVRAAFELEPGLIHLAGLLLAAHPKAVRDAITRHRDGLDRNPASYVVENKPRFERETRRAAARYLGGDEQDFALTDSTTMGIGLVYNSIAIRAGQEILTTEHDYHATHDAIAFKTARSGATSRQIALYDDAAQATAAEIVQRITQELRPKTRVLALTWVHSSTGMKLPIRDIAHAVSRANEGRAEDDRILLCVDGVHAMGVEDFTVDALGCDFLMAGTHKWLFGPRGTGIVWGRSSAQKFLTPTIPSFTDGQGWGGNLSPGGFHSFEHRWALAEAFDWQRGLGRERVAKRIHALAGAFKSELSKLKHVTLKTPRSSDLSAGIIAFEVKGMSAAAVESSLKTHRIIASKSPYSPSYARITPGLLNDENEIEPTVRALSALA